LTCIVCRKPGEPFCREHAQAPAAQRGGWLSAYRRRVQMVGLGAVMMPPVPLNASNVWPRVWVGGEPPFDRRLPHFSMVVLCAREIQPEAREVAWEGRIVRARLVDDYLERRELQDAVAAARAVADEIRKGGRVLVTCAAGRNRSALVAAMAILMRTPRATPNHVIQVIRRRRNPDCLTNPHFAEILRRIWSSRMLSPSTQAR
jgi:Dual specificity phosphatase, catalytic domain